MIPKTELKLGPHANDRKYSLFVGALGYEQRASFIATKFRELFDHGVVTVLDEVLRYSFEANRAVFHAIGVDEVGGGDTGAREFFTSWHREHPGIDYAQFSIAIDISSMTRSRLANIVLGLCDLSALAGEGISVDFLYAPGDYSPADGDDLITEISEPVTPEFAGWSENPDAPTSLVIGVGYESEKALGAVEYLDPAQIWCFVPTGEDGRYDADVESANETMWRSSPAAERIPYSVSEPESTFISLESLVYGLSRNSRPILLPFGPKIFALCTFLVGIVHSPRVIVWRVSGGAYTDYRDCVASGKVISLPVIFESCKATDESAAEIDQLGIMMLDR